jgi:hypothetical protein
MATLKVECPGRIGLPPRTRKSSSRRPLARQYQAHLAEAARMFKALVHDRSLSELRTIVTRERHSYGWSFLSGEVMGGGIFAVMAASRDAVAGLFADPMNSPKWMDDIDRCEPISGTPGFPGSTYRLGRSLARGSSSRRCCRETCQTKSDFSSKHLT